MQFTLPETAVNRDVSYPDEDYADWNWCARVPTTWKLEAPLISDREEDCNG